MEGVLWKETKADPVVLVSFVLYILFLVGSGCSIREIVRATHLTYSDFMDLNLFKGPSHLLITRLIHAPSVVMLQVGSSVS